MSRYINPFTDFGFKYLFENAEILKMFLNALFEKEGKVITKVQYMNKERNATVATDRTIIYDVYCKVDHGEDFILEMQNKYQDTFKDRALYYASRSIIDQGVKGREWKYRLHPVYCIYFMNFHLDDKVTDRVITNVQLIDRERNELFCDKLRMIFIDLPAFKKTADECENDLDCWIYNIKNLETMKGAALQGFDKFYSWAEVAAMPRRKRLQYEESLKNYRDMLMDKETNRNARKRAREEGLAEGALREKYATARNMKAKGLSSDLIADVTGLSIDEIEKL
ncbi:MAG: Rpn family recombination-promoting nuclease/putative transposase [Bacteroidales bacterium]|nr:Rpn family recombination-promoting nuclease/putative transposase [Bacteroidales bacterium]